MNNATIKQILIGKGITQLYHANSMVTACTFLENGGLLSRGCVEDRKLNQTDQQSDQLDKEVGVFYDIFFDSVDIHERSRRINCYGPVVFVYDINVIDSLPEGAIRITRDNPIRWNSAMEDQEKYFQTAEELESQFHKGTFAQHITLCNQHGPLSLDYLKKIIIDDPGDRGKRYLDQACEHLQGLLRQFAPEVVLDVRQCSAECHCRDQYSKYHPSYTRHKFRWEP